jgi:hypothetical protein
MAVDDQVYAQPLYASAVAIPNRGTHNMLYVATVSNSIFAFDADTGVLLWWNSYNVAGGHAPRNIDVSCGSGNRDYLGNIGIVSTPVIDATTSTMYFITRSIDSNNTMMYRKMAVDITNGNHKFNSPQPMFTPSNTQPAMFDATHENQRAGLVLANKNVYVSFGAYCDADPYHGWVVGFPANNLASTQVGIFNTSPTVSDGSDGNPQNTYRAGIWQGGNAPAVDATNNLYLMTGNGHFDSASNWGMSLLKLSSTLKLGAGTNSWMTPSNYLFLNQQDNDFGSAGPSVYSSLNYVLGGGKDGRIYARPTNALGGVVNAGSGFQAVDPTVVPNAPTHHIHNGLILWTGPSGPSVYVWGENDYLRRYLFSPTATPQFSAPSSGAVGNVLPPLGMPGGIMSLSANGSRTGTGVVWATTPSQGDANQATRPGVLRAFNAETLALLWDSSLDPGDDIYELAKFNPPLVANGKVYMPSFSGVVSAFGLRAGPSPSVLPGYYQIRTGTAADKCVDVANAGTADGTNVQQWTCNGTDAQRWQLINVANDVYEIHTVLSDKCLDVAGSGTANGTNVQEYTCNGGVNQHWRVRALGNSGYELMPQTAANKCLHVSGGGTADGTNIIQWTCNGGPAQSFTLALDEDMSFVPNNTFRFGTVVADKCVDVSNGGALDGTNVQQLTCNGTDEQRWRIKNIGSGVYEIRAAVSDECLDVTNGATDWGTNVQTLTCNGHTEQGWQFSWVGAGQYQLLPQLGASTCLDVSGAGTADGTNIQEWGCNNTNAQLFRVMAP